MTYEGLQLVGLVVSLVYFMWATLKSAWSRRAEATWVVAVFFATGLIGALGFATISVFMNDPYWLPLVLCMGGGALLSLWRWSDNNGTRNGDT